MHSKSKRNYGATFLVILGLLISISIVWKTKAQDFVSNQTLEVSPPSQEVSLDPGQTIELKAKIRNKSHEKIPLTVHIEDFTASGDEGQVALTTGSDYSVVNWAKVVPQAFTLEAGEQKEVTAKIQVPKNSAGGRYGSFVFSIPSNNKSANAAALSQEIASLFLMRISGPVDENLHITSLDVPHFSEFGPVPFTVRLSNSGNIHVKTTGLLNVTNMFGGNTANIIIPETNIFPGANRVLNTKLDKKFLFGYYKALTVLNYGSKNTSLTAETSFVVLPVRIMAVAAIVLFLLFLMRKRISKAFKVLFN